MELDINKNRKYKIKVIKNSIVYTKKLKIRHLLMLYYLVFLKNYLKKKYLRIFIDNLISYKID